MTGAAAALDPDLFDVELPRAPYPGLRPFERHEWPIFFGREPMIQDAITRLLAQNLVVVHGDSGCGKSSLIRAGVQVQLEQQHTRGGHRWRTCDMLPREAPLWRLAQALAVLREREPPPDAVREIRRALNAGRGAAARLDELLCANPADRVCILVDQFEELFRFARETSADEAALFVEILVGLLEEAERRRQEPDVPPLRVHAILTMRSEFLGVCARFKGLAEAVNATQYLLPQMERPALLRAIREPALLYDGEVSRPLADRLIADAGGGQDQLPLIQHGLMRLWQRKVDAPTGLAEAATAFELAEAPAPFRYEAGPAWRLDLDDYQGAGDLAALLSGHADQVMAAAAPDSDRQKIVEHLFRALTDINAEGQAVRRPQTLAELVAVTGSGERTLTEIIGHFREEGVSFLRPYGTARIEPENEIDISHEALIRCWQKISDKKDAWLQREFRDGLIWRSLLVQAEEGGPLSPLATSTRDAWLATLPSETWCERYGGGWSDVQTLMARSHEERARYERREQQAWIGDSYFPAEQARGRLKEGLPVTAMQLALAGLPGDPQDPGARPWVGETAGALVEAMGAQREIRDLGGHEGGVWSVAFSPQGDRIVSGASDGTVRLWQLDGTPAGQPFKGHEGMVSSVAFSPQGDRIVSGGHDGTVRLWQLDGTPAGEPFKGHEGRVLSVAFSLKGDRIVSGGYDGTVRLWQLDGTPAGEPFKGHEGVVRSVAFSPKGDRIVSGGDDGTVRLWQLDGTPAGQPFKGHEGGVSSVAFSPKGDRIVSGGWDGTVRLWQLHGTPAGQPFKGHEGPVSSVAFSPQGDRILSGGLDGTVRLWDVASGSEVLVLRSHGRPVIAAAFTSDDVVSGSDDRMVSATWVARNKQELIQTARNRLPRQLTDAEKQHFHVTTE